MEQKFALKSKEPTWLLVLPVIGVARIQGMAIVKAFQQELAERAHVFDSKEVLSQVQSCLRSEGEPLTMDWLNQQLVVRALEIQATHILCLSSAPLDPHYLRLLRNQGILAIHWLYEDHHLADSWMQVLPSYDLFCSNQAGAVERECDQQHVSFQFLPLAAQLPIMGGGALWHARSLDIAYVGSPSPYRISVLETLAASGLTLGIHGEGWDDYHGFLVRDLYKADPTSTQPELELYRQARMAVHLSFGYPGQVDEDRPLSPLIWDSIALGAYPMLERSPTNELSLEGIHYHEHTGAIELLALALSLRQNGVDSAIQTQNQHAIQRFHTMNHRVRQMFTMLGM